MVMDEGQRRLLTRAQKGDMEAFAEMFEPLRPLLVAVASRLVDRDLAQDVVMDTFLKAWQALPRFAGRASLRTWLFRIARNCALDHIRRAQRRREVSLADDESGHAAQRDVADVYQPSPSKQMERSETAAHVRAAMGRLPELHRTVLELRFQDDLSYTEIAAVLGVSIGTVMSRLFNAKKKLRRALEEST